MAKPEAEAAVDAAGLHYRDLNNRIRALIAEGKRRIVLNGVNGQRYIADGLDEEVAIVINGVPGNDLGAFMDGPHVVVNDNAQDCVGNTMNDGKILVRGNAGDVIGYGMRGGKVFIRGDVGYRVGIHMKSYRDHVPLIVAGGGAGDFFGEYMAGGILVLLGAGTNGSPVGSYLGTGMHGGTIYIRGKVEDHQLGREVRIFPLCRDDVSFLSGVLDEYSRDMEVDTGEFKLEDFIKLSPFSHRPYGNMYCY